MKLQKLIYIANGIHLALNNEPLITEHVEAWPYGPVVKVVYDTYKYFGNSNIVLGVFGHYDLNIKLDDKAKKSFDDAWKIGKDVDAIRLSNWTHNSGSPWSKAKEENRAVIPDEYMQEYFKDFLK